MEPLARVKGRALLVKRGVVPLDIAQVAGGSDDIFPRGPFGREQPGNVRECPPRLRSEIADMDALAGFVDAGGPRDEQDRQAIEVDAQPARKRTGLGIVESLIQDLEVGDAAFFDRSRGQAAQKLYV